MAVDGERVVRDQRLLSVRRTKIYTVRVGDREVHDVRIEKDRTLLLAGARGQPVRVYVDDVLAAEAVASRPSGPASPRDPNGRSAARRPGRGPAITEDRNEDRSLRATPGWEWSPPPLEPRAAVEQTGLMSRFSAGSHVALSGLLLSAALAGCSTVPYFPARSVIPSPSGGLSTPSAASQAQAPTSDASTLGSIRGPEIELRGALVGDDGQQAQLSADLQLGDLGAVQRTGEHRGSRGLAVRGTVTLTNPTNRINVPAASVLVVVQAGYRTKSKACNTLPPPEDMTWGRYCWYLLAVASPYGKHDDLVALQPGEQRVRPLTTSATGLGQLRVSDADMKEIGAALRRPAVVMAVTSAVNPNGARLRTGCSTESTVATPDSARSKAEPAVTQNVVAATTKTIACQDFRYVGP